MVEGQGFVGGWIEEAWTCAQGLPSQCRVKPVVGRDRDQISSYHHVLLELRTHEF